MTERPLPDWLVVARREFLERVRTMWFVIVTVLGPVGMAAMIVVPAYLAHKSSTKKVRIHVVDRSVDAAGKPTGVGEGIIDFANKLKLNYEIVVVPPATTTKELLGKIRTEKIDGFLEIPKDALNEGTVVYRGANATNFRVTATLHQVINFAVRSKKNKVEPARLLALVAPVPFKAQHTTGEDEGSSGQAKFLVGYAVAAILYMAILLYAVNVSRSVALEKSSRVVEIMVSAVKPRSLMLGKILGVGGAGLFQLAIWAAMGFLLLTYSEQLLGAFGVRGGSLTVPGLSIQAIALVLAYFLVGYFFYASLYAAIGAMVNSEQEAQQAQTPVALLLMVPLLCLPLIANDPRGGAAQLLTMIPFSSPVLMPMRYLLGGASTMEVVWSMTILVFASAGAVWLAARIYRVGILMYGKRPSLRELGRWIRYS